MEYRKINKKGGIKNKGDWYHKKMLLRILEEGTMDENPRPHWQDGTPAYTKSVNFGGTQEYDLSQGECPILTLRPIAWKSAVKEVLWIYQMQSNKLSDLHDLGIKYWDDWDVGDGTIGARYGETVRRHDLMNKLLSAMEKDPFGRRHILSLWQNDDFEEPGLNPCCFLNQYNVRRADDGKLYLDAIMFQRSSDYMTAVSINEMQYVALQLMLCSHLGYHPGFFRHVLGNTQIYDRHMENAKILLNRTHIPADIHFGIKEGSYGKKFGEFTIDDFELVGYPLDKIKETNPQLHFELAV